MYLGHEMKPNLLIAAIGNAREKDGLQAQSFKLFMHFLFCADDMLVEG